MPVSASVVIDREFAIIDDEVEAKYNMLLLLLKCLKSIVWV
jgi:hypothetical protein